MAPFSYLIHKHGDDLAILWIDSHPDMGTGETASRLRTTSRP
jgi:arginase